MSTLFVTFWDPASNTPAGDVELTVWPETPVGSLRDLMPSQFASRDLYVGTQLIDPVLTFGDSPIVSGSYISLGGPGPALNEQWASIAGVLRVAKGPDAGQSFALSPGYHDIARRADVSVMLTDQEVTRRGHVRLTVTPSGAVTVTDLGAANGTYVGDVKILEPVPLPPGAELGIGTTVLTWVPRPAIGRDAVRSPDGLLHFDRSFAVSPQVPGLKIKLPSTLETPRNLMSVIIPLLLPMMAGGLMAAVLRQPTFLLLAVLGPIGGLGTYLVDRRQRKIRKAELEVKKAEVENGIRDHLVLETAVRHERSPGQAELLMAATGMSAALWPRNAGSEDGLVVRVGTATLPASVAFEGEPWPELPVPETRDVPVTLDLRTAGVVGVVGTPEQSAGLARWLIIQLATLRSPEDLRLVVISSTEGQDLAWTRWLPHLAGGEEAAVPCWVGNTPQTRLRRVAELQETVVERVKQNAGGARNRFDDVVVILDGALSLRQTPGMKEILRDGPSVGVYTLCVDTGSMNECRAECRLGADGTLRLTRSRTDTPLSVTPDSCELVLAERIARSLAPLRDRLSLSSSSQSIPYPVRFLDLLGIPGEPSAEQVRALWLKKNGPATQVPLGADAEGVVTVDLAGQGPHTMLGGATGAGKSYLLQTLVTSLLMANSPDELNLVLVDFKGGSAFLPFQHCPHVVSLIRSTGATAADVFDEAAAKRMLASVRTEVRRRESLLAQYGGEIDEYWKARASHPRLTPMPRLVLIFDEFARVLEVDPEFLKELVNVAAKGRSLGMHLVLSTQSLQGKLSPELKNNIDLRITLRQNEPADSTEVLGAPDAALIPGRLRGRGLILCTKDEFRIPRPFQSGFLGAPPPRGGARPAQLRFVGWLATGTPRPDHVVTISGVTDQQLCIEAIEAASIDTALPFLPLLPPLPARLRLDQLEEAATHGVPPTSVPFGLADEPERQAQPEIGLDLAGTERVMVAGGPQQGRTTFARTLIDGITSRFRPDQAHLYVVEREPGGLAEYEGAAHCGAVIAGSEPDRLRRLVEWLSQEVERRRALRMAGQLGAEPKIVLIIDGWEQFENRSDPLWIETTMVTALRDVVAAGVTVGIHVVAIGGQDMLNGKLPNLYQRRLLLSFPKQEVRRQHLPAGTAIPALVPGRAADGADGRTIQLCEPSRDAGDIVASSMAAARGLSPQQLPVTIPKLPPSLASAGLSTLGQPARWIPIGVGGARVEPIGIDLFGEDSHLMLISGPDRSGRTTTLGTLLEGLRRRDVPVLLVAAGRSPLAELTPVPGRLEIVRGSTIKDADLRQAAEQLGSADYVVLVDDCHALTLEAAVDGFIEQPTMFAEICQTGERRRALVMAGDASLILSGQRRSLARIVQELLTSGYRLLLTPTRALDAREQGFVLEGDQLFAAPPGRGYLGSGRTMTLVQVAGHGQLDGQPSAPSTITP